MKTPTETTPLRVEDNRRRKCACYCLVNEKGVRVAEVYDFSLPHVLAAAPALLAALEAIAQFGELDGSPFALSAAKTARAAIARATQ